MKLDNPIHAGRVDIHDLRHILQNAQPVRNVLSEVPALGVELKSALDFNCWEFACSIALIGIKDGFQCPRVLDLGPVSFNDSLLDGQYCIQVE